MRASHEVEKNETKAVRKQWENEYQEWMRKTEALEAALRDLVAQEGDLLHKGKVCNCEINVTTHYFASQHKLRFIILKLLSFMKQVLLKSIFLKTMPSYIPFQNPPTQQSYFRFRHSTPGLYHKCVLSQASTFISNAVQKAVETHNSLAEKYDQILQNINDMKQIGKLVNKELLPLMGSAVLKTVDEVFDKSMMHKTVLAGPDHREWVVGSNDYFNNMKRYYRFKAAAPGENVEFVLEKVDLECHYDYVQYYESMDCNDDVAKEAMYAQSSSRVCNTVERGAGADYPFTDAPIRLSGRCIYIKLYSDYMVSGNSLELHYLAKKYQGVKARYNSIK